MKHKRNKAIIDPIGKGLMYSGLGRYLATFTSILNKNSYEVHCLCDKEIDEARVNADYGIRVGKITSIDSKINLTKRLPFGQFTKYINAIILALRERKYDIVIRQSPYIPILTFAKKAILLVDFPFEKRPRSFFWNYKLALYNVIICNSKFTKYWIKEYWNREAIVLYPPISPVTPLDKEKSILAVGRFQESSRDKKHYELIEVFKEIKKIRGYEEWTLNLAGRLVDRPYFNKLKELAADSRDILFHTDIDYSKLCELYGQSSLFWHACGYGVNEMSSPDKLEHFGIVVAEAMSAGCVPIVLGKGGPAEIVTNGSTGYHWSSWEELKHHTLELMANESKRNTFAAKGAEYAREYFSDTKFESDFLTILNPSTK